MSKTEVTSDTLRFGALGLNTLTTSQFSYWDGSLISELTRLTQQSEPSSLEEYQAVGAQLVSTMRELEVRLRTLRQDAALLLSQANPAPGATVPDSGELAWQVLSMQHRAVMKLS